MVTITYDQKLILVRVMVASLDLKSSDIEKQLNISRSVVSTHLRGERDYPPIDMFLVEQFFGVKIKEYSIA